MREELLNSLIKKLEEDIDNYCGNYGSLESKLGETLQQILNILKIMNGEMPFEDWYVKELLDISKEDK